MSPDGVIDIHAHLWLGRAERDAAQMRRAAQRFGIERILVSSLGSYKPDEAEIRALNRQSAELAARDELFRAYVTVAPELPGSLDTLRRGAEDFGAVGMKLWVSCLCDESACDPLYDYCAAHALPVLIHAFAKTIGQLPGESTAEHVRRAALRHPDTRFIMAHLGGNCYHGLPLVRDLPNVWADFSGSTCRADDLPYALEQLGAERLLFGSDMPGSVAMSLGQVTNANLPEAARRSILRNNALALFPALRDPR